MKRSILTFLLIFFVSIFCSFTNIYAESWDLNTKSYIYYYWNWCAHCATLDRYLERTNAYELLNIEKKEVWTNQEYNAEMLKECRELWINENHVWIPLFVVEDSDGKVALIWEKEIVSYIEPYLWDTSSSSDNRAALVLVVLWVLAVGIPVVIISLSNKKWGK